MKKTIRNFTKKMLHSLTKEMQREINEEKEILALGALLSKQSKSLNSTNLNDFEFRIFSQWGDDGIIQHLITNLDIENEIFIEFGVENYLESNTRFLMMHNNWEGLIMDGSAEAMNFVKSRDWYWRHTLKTKAVFITRENINQLLKESGYRNVGILHIDIDGNDYFVAESIDMDYLNPSIIIVEYNSVFGNKRPISVPYDKDFVRTEKHYSNLYFGASLPAFCHLFSNRNYALVGGNLAGNNAYFVRNDLLNAKIIKVDPEVAYKPSKFRESRAENGELTFLIGEERLELIKGLKVYNVITGETEIL